MRGAINPLQLTSFCRVQQHIYFRDSVNNNWPSQGLLLQWWFLWNCTMHGNCATRFQPHWRWSSMFFRNIRTNLFFCFVRDV